MSNSETNEVLQRLISLEIKETPKDDRKVERECYSLDSKTLQLVPATPNSGGPGTFLTQLKKRRKNKLNRVYNYEANQQFVKAPLIQQINCGQKRESSEKSYGPKKTAVSTAESAPDISESEREVHSTK